GHLDPRVLADPAAVQRVAAQVREWYLPDAAAEEVAEALGRLRGLPAWVGSFDGGHQALAALKDMTSQLVGRFTGAVEQATRQAHGSGRLTRYGGELVVPRATLCEITALKGIAAVFVMTAEIHRPVYQRQRQVIAELAAALTRLAPDVLEPPFAS